MVQEIETYFHSNLDSYLISVWEHIWISLVSLFFAMVVGITVGIYCSYTKKQKTKMINLFQVLRIIPSLALLILFMPLMGTGKKPAIIALVILAIPPIFMNTIAGFKGVPEFMLETAAALGMTKGQSFLKVQIWLALPSIITGVRTALVEIIASATLAAYIGGGGLGTIIFTGIGLNRTDLLMIGGVSVAVLSLITGMLLGLLQRCLSTYKKSK